MTHAQRAYGAILLSVLSCASCAPRPEPATSAEVTAVVEAFYAAIKKGDAAAAMSYIAPDATFVESGRLETRAEYEANHLPADIDFERQIDGKRQPWRVSLNGDTAWVIGMTDYQGKVDGDEVNFVSAQLTVLARGPGAWQIRAIHWSSMRKLPI